MFELLWAWLLSPVGLAAVGDKASAKPLSQAPPKLEPGPCSLGPVPPNRPNPPFSMRLRPQHAEHERTCRHCLPSSPLPPPANPTRREFRRPPSLPARPTRLRLSATSNSNRQHFLDDIRRLFDSTGGAAPTTDCTPNLPRVWSRPALGDGPPSKCRVTALGAPETPRARERGTGMVPSSRSDSDTALRIRPSR